MSAATLTPQRSFSMKNLFKLFGIIVFVTVIGFSMNDCGGDNSSSGTTVELTNNSGSTIYVGIWSADASSNTMAKKQFRPLNSGEKASVHGLTSGRDYFLGKFTNTEEGGVLTADRITQRSNTFTVEEGKTITFTYNTYGFSKN